MGHWLIEMWIKVYYNRNTFTGLEFSIVTVFDQKIRLKSFWKGKNYKSPSDIRTHD